MKPEVGEMWKIITGWNFSEIINKKSGIRSKTTVTPTHFSIVLVIDPPDSKTGYTRVFGTELGSEFPLENFVERIQ